MYRFIALFFLLTLSSTGFSKNKMAAPLVSIPTHDAFFDQLKKLCGKSFGGAVVTDMPKSGGFEGPLVMHIRNCTDREIQIPFHVNENRSRTWIISKTGSGLTLKHDHRMEDGSFDKSTMYGGHTTDAGWNHVQTFPADQYSKELFIKLEIPQALDNVWSMSIYPNKFSYSLVRPGREFRVEFDLTKEVKTPPVPWGY
jgi:hypothetical protein